jgi:hypothetical protein
MWACSTGLRLMASRPEGFGARAVDRNVSPIGLR